MYGKLKMIARLFAEDNPDGTQRCDRFYSIGGPLGAYYGTATGATAVDGFHLEPMIDEDFPLATDDGTMWGKPNSHSPKLNQMVLAEQTVFTCHPSATHFRYPLIYGPLQLIPGTAFCSLCAFCTVATLTMLCECV